MVKKIGEEIEAESTKACASTGRKSKKLKNIAGENHASVGYPLKNIVVKWLGASVWATRLFSRWETLGHKSTMEPRRQFIGASI